MTAAQTQPQLRREEQHVAAGYSLHIIRHNKSSCTCMFLRTFVAAPCRHLHEYQQTTCVNLWHPIKLMRI